jgi:pantoate--beta-alanine ligase|tara:strand:+ start:46 stop:894 length:849 start_codon:yes stop_codon:yes gene_type:complete
MKIINSIIEIKNLSFESRKQGLSVGLVPTMGFLHEGHLNLFRQCRKENEVTIASIFVNPIQFGPNEDLDSYPSDLDGDQKKLAAEGVDFLFMPKRDEFYQKGFKTSVIVNEISKRLCGQSRPILFNGVTTVVLKLFNIIQPQKAYFGEKDWQQLEIISTMARDLNLDVEIMRIPIIREEDGLAMSSRNAYLSEPERQSALSLNKGLLKAKSLVLQGEFDATLIKKEIESIISKEPVTEIDYISVCDPITFLEQKKINHKTLIALAVKVGTARLIDNCLVERN